MNPNDRKYSEQHEWALVQDGLVVVGITDYAQDQLGDVVYIDLPEVGAQAQQFGKFGEIESVKSVSELFSPVSGEVVARNEALLDHPELVNSSPYDEGWMLRIRPSDLNELNNLQTAEQYQAFTEAEEAK